MKMVKIFFGPGLVWSHDNQAMGAPSRIQGHWRLCNCLYTLLWVVLGLGEVALVLSKPDGLVMQLACAT